MPESIVRQCVGADARLGKGDADAYNNNSEQIHKPRKNRKELPLAYLPDLAASIGDASLGRHNQQSTSISVADMPIGWEKLMSDFESSPLVKIGPGENSIGVCSCDVGADTEIVWSKRRCFFTTLGGWTLGKKMEVRKYQNRPGTIF